MTEETISLGHLPEGRWQFDERVSQVFDDMLDRSIPQYRVMRELVTHMARKFIMPSTTVVDLGCARGEAIADLVDVASESVRFVGVDVSEPMLGAAMTRFSGRRNVEIRHCDLREQWPTGQRCSVVLSVLTLQFVPIEYRQRVVRSAYLHLGEGGALILVEKILGATAELDELMVKRYLQMKADNGYTSEEIERKRLSLEGVLVPLTASGNVELLQGAGFRELDCFWRWLNFAGWVAVRR